MTCAYTITSGAVVVNQHDKILLKLDPKRGWELPGGHVEPEETFKETVIREVKEETGIDIDLIKFCGVSQEVRKGICNMWWLAVSISGKPQTSSESLEVAFFDVEEALQLITHDEFKQELLACLNQDEHPFLLNFYGKF
ncbi:NUDIX hydrolase [Amphibacillus cookii]|uniref:NUDIX hydrolase n=1 Tax=Amphibacillus cookii TaxID=767787 RepID=UPI00195DA566|nr:NUDIX hydrolase [Amphibacillus cookii]MBM7541181.1 8-oxo-dGTP pyrophosphatase MutT (NUDIX family) [Amphibacillus cookii]